MVYEKTINFKSKETVAAMHSYGSTVPKLFAVFTAIAVIGWAVSIFLTGVHFWVLPLPASFDVTGTPWAVMTSEWAYVMGIPLALMGGFYYLTTLVLSGLWFQTRHPLVLKVLTPITIIGVMSSAFFVYLQLFVIEAICPFCLVSAVATVLLLVLELVMLRMSKLPPLRELVRDARSAFDRKGLTWMFLLFIIALLPVISFWFATIIPAPGS
ncbi:vitamin K epoxide reductase family protein [Alkalihalobacterium elongatum]|uniref:vitamin K epoxide reductase family protein n=1 Tax=Alkalihalobacterium elongatum TaxID=2675466 RepID=UPI001C200CE1|nr:vitamin K epoxide reductase family protein [Alkalihalobacterium elongatum]